MTEPDVPFRLQADHLLDANAFLPALAVRGLSDANQKALVQWYDEVKTIVADLHNARGPEVPFPLREMTS